MGCGQRSTLKTCYEVVILFAASLHHKYFSSSKKKNQTEEQNLQSFLWMAVLLNLLSKLTVLGFKIITKQKMLMEIPTLLFIEADFKFNFLLRRLNKSNVFIFKLPLLREIKNLSFFKKTYNNMLFKV